MLQETESRIPQSGDALILADGRRFVVATAEDGIRGWWFSAQALDGRCTLQGNMRLDWDPQSRAWRPVGAHASPSHPPPMRRALQPRHKQLD